VDLRISGLIATFALAGLLGSTQSLAQNAYITNSISDTVSVIDTETNKVTATIPVGNGPLGAAVIPNGRKVYVTNTGSDTVSVIDTAKNKLTATIPVGNEPFGVAMTPDGKKVYVTNFRSNNVSVIDTAKNKVTDTIPVGVGPRGVAVTPDGRKVYLADFAIGGFFGTFSVIDTATNKVTATIPFPSEDFVETEAVAVSPDGSKVYVTINEQHGSGVVSVINTSTNTLAFFSDLDHMFGDGLAVSADGSKVYVTSSLAINMGFVSVFGSAKSATIPVGSEPLGVAVTPDGRKVYVANGGSNTVSVIDTTTNKVTATIPVGSGPAAFGLFIQPAPKFAGTPGKANCYGKSASALVRQDHGLNAAAAALGFSSVRELQNAILEFCEGIFPPNENPHLKGPALRRDSEWALSRPFRWGHRPGDRP
jgi:YVTN family beta-propeller protein